MQTMLQCSPSLKLFCVKNDNLIQFHLPIHLKNILKQKKLLKDIALLKDKVYSEFEISKICFPKFRI